MGLEALNTAQLVVDVQLYTGDPQSALLAGGYGALIQSVTGQAPMVTALPDGRAKMTVTDEQAFKMRAWLDSQVGGIMAGGGPPPKLEAPFGAILGPWATAKVVPVAITAVLIGWVAHWWVAK